jgi:hypothetical protein
LYISNASSDRNQMWNVGSFNFDIEKLFSSLKVNSIQNGRPITTIQTSTIDMKNTTKYCFVLYIMMSWDVRIVISDWCIQKKRIRKGWQAIITKMTEVLIVTFGQNMVFLYRYGCTSQMRPVIAKITL